MTPRPLWRWWLFCFVLDLCFRTKPSTRLNDWLGDVMAWTVLPEWMGAEVGPDGEWFEAEGEVPF